MRGCSGSGQPGDDHDFDHPKRIFGTRGMRRRTFWVGWPKEPEHGTQPGSNCADAVKTMEVAEKILAAALLDG